MNTTTAAEKLGISVSTIQRWCRTGRIQATKNGRAWIIDPTSLPAVQEEITVQRYIIEETQTKVCGADVTAYNIVDTTTGATARTLYHRDDAEVRLARLNAGETIEPAKPTATTGTTGWSRHSRGIRRYDAVSDAMLGSFGLASPAAPGTCHFCGLNARTCDCN